MKKRKNAKGRFCPHGHDTLIVGRYANGNCAQCGRDNGRIDPTKDSRKTKFCPKGHDKDIVGRDKLGACQECKRTCSSKLNPIYYEEHRAEILENKKEYGQENKEVICQKKKVYYDENQEEILMKKKNYYEDNKEEILEKSAIHGKTIQSRFAQLKSHAKSAKHPMLLIFEQYNKLIVQPCYYCGVSLLNRYGGGLDRINNDKNIGYVVGNVLPCCGSCNRTRGDRYTVKEMKVMITALLKFRSKQKCQ